MTKPFGFVLDLETSGLDPNADNILELGMILVDDELTELDRFEQVAHWAYLTHDEERGICLPPSDVDDVVVEMHTKSGLWLESHLSDVSLNEMLSYAWVWVQEAYSRMNLNNELLPLIGSTIGFDRSFLQVVRPKFLSLFHYRSVDISSIKILDNMWIGESADKPVANRMHRSIPDCLDSIQELNYYRKKLFSAWYT